MSNRKKLVIELTEDLHNHVKKTTLAEGRTLTGLVTMLLVNHTKYVSKPQVDDLGLDDLDFPDAE